MSGFDYDQMVRVLSFGSPGIERSGDVLSLDPSFVTTLAKAIRLVCSGEWASDGDVMNGILCADGTFIDSREAHAMSVAPDFPQL